MASCFTQRGSAGASAGACRGLLVAYDGESEGPHPLSLPLTHFTQCLTSRPAKSSWTSAMMLRVSSQLICGMVARGVVVERLCVARLSLGCVHDDVVVSC